ncbi:MAG: response regulator [Alphaproteobacteria bacterium]|nr:response regulator [Alphaproteobacteria bacterium]
MARILVVEDEPALREFLRRALTKRGDNVAIAGHGGEAMLKLRDGRYDLMLTDIAMPEMDGIELALKAAQDFPAVRLLLMTGYTDEKRRAEALEHLVNKVLMKPFSMTELFAAIDAAMDKPMAEAAPGQGARSA